jgi:beta-lactamase superfamily II metal-dependent hydrolase
VFSKIYSGAALADRDSDRDQKAESCVTGKGWHQDVMSYQFLHPQLSSRVGINDASCVLSVVSGDHSVLLTGGNRDSRGTRLPGA